MSKRPGNRKRLLFLTVVMATGSAHAHHSPAAFDMRAPVEVQGTVTRYDWQNPHVYVVVDGTDDSGRSGEWLLEGDPTPLMSRSGWSAGTLQPGDVVSARVFPDRDPEKRHGLLAALTTTDGTTLRRRSGGSDGRIAARDVAGVWDGLPNFAPPLIDQESDPPRVYTEAAMRARATYDRSQYPPARCLPFPTPMLMVLPYLVEIEVLEDRVVMTSEFYGAQRTIYTDGRDHPSDGPRTIQGHSIGRWEDTTLIVDTRLFADFRLAHGPGVPSGAQKHTIEQFALSADGTELEVEIFVEDPEYLVEPFSVSATWTYAPNGQIAPFTCDPENAQFFLSE